MKLYELNEMFQNIQTLIEDGQEGLEDTLESINLAIEDKLENIAKVIKNLEAEAKAFREEEKRLAERRRSIENDIKRLKEYAEETLRTTGNRKIKTGLFTFAIHKNPPSVQVFNETIVPKEYFIIPEPKLDKKKIQEAIKNGESVAGVELKQTESLRIR